MSNYNSLKATINANIRTNGNEEITGSILNAVLTAIVDSLGAGYQFMGVATTSTNPGTPDQKVLYVAAEGTYSRLGNLSVPANSIGFFKYNGSWSLETINCVTLCDNLTTNDPSQALTASMGKALNDRIDSMIEGGEGSIIESDHPKTNIVIYAGSTRWESVTQSSNVKGEMIPLETGTTYTLNFANGLGGWAVVRDASPVSGQNVDYVLPCVNTARGDVATIEGVTGQYLFVRADSVQNGRIFPVITTMEAEPLVVLRREVQDEPHEGSSGVVSSGGLYTILSQINNILSQISDALPTGQSYPPGRHDVPVSSVTFYNRTPGGTATVTTRIVSNTIEIPTGATGFHLKMASGFESIIYFLRQNGTWDQNVANSGNWAQDAYCDYPSGYSSGGVWVYIKKTSGEDLTPVETAAAILEMYFDVPSEYFLPVASTEMAQRRISILFVGNSLTQDAVSYVPYLLRTLVPYVDFKLYIWYNSGYTLAQAYTKMVNDQACDMFSRCENGISWVNGTATMASVLASYDFDVVCLQEYFNYMSSYTDVTDFNNVIDYIRTHYDKEFKVATLFHAPKRSGAQGVFNLTKAGNELILKKTIAESMISPGIALYRALSTSLNNLGDRGGMSTDGTHAQEGLPCLLQAFVVYMWIMHQLSLPVSIANCPVQMTTAIYNQLNVPGANLGTGVITGTDAENFLAQDVAIQGDKEGRGIEQNAMINMID